MQIVKVSTQFYLQKRGIYLPTPLMVKVTKYANQPAINHACGKKGHTIQYNIIQYNTIQYP